MSDTYNREQQKLLLLHEIIKEMEKWPLDINRDPKFKELVLQQKEELKSLPGHFMTESVRNAEEQVTFNFSFLKSPPFPFSKGLQRELIEELDEECLVYYYNHGLLRYDGKKYNLVPDQKAIAKKKAGLMVLPSVELVCNKDKLEKAYNALILKYPDLILPERELSELERNMENSPAKPLWKDGNKFRYYLKDIKMRPQIFRLCDFLVKHYGKYYSLDQLSSVIDKDSDGANISKDNVYNCCCELRKALKRHLGEDVLQGKNKEGMYRIFVE